MNDSKGKFVLNKETVKAMLKSQEVMDVALSEAAKLGEVEENFVGTQRCWVEGKKS